MSGSHDLAAIVRATHAHLVEAEPSGAADLDRARAAIRRVNPLLSETDVASAALAVTARATGLGALQPVLSDPSVSEVMLNGDGSVWVERAGRLTRTDISVSSADTAVLIERILGPLGLRADRLHPVADARLPDGSRVNVVVPPLAVDGACVTIRRFGAQPFDLEDLCPFGVADFLRWAVAARSNIVVSGGTGAGKTTLLNALAGTLADDERVVTVEDTAELRLPHPHVVRLEARPATAEGIGAASIRDLVRNALRMRPDRIVVGEVRGAEAMDMLWAMNTGHEGSLSTCHANSPVDALRRLEVMVLTAGLEMPLVAVRDQLTSGLDLIVQIARLPDGARRVVAVAEVVDPFDPAARVRPLADATGMRTLPRRATRRSGCSAPDPRWCR